MDTETCLPTQVPPLEPTPHMLKKRGDYLGTSSQQPSEWRDAKMYFF
jgi:hypothetical protein